METTSTQLTADQLSRSAVGKCAHFIRRQERYCTALVSQSGEHFCAQHTPEALAEARARSLRLAPADNQHPKRQRYRRLESAHLCSRVDSHVPPPEAPSWLHVLPIHLDIGCARGRWIRQVAADDHKARRPLSNHLGVEIRSDLVQEANTLVSASGESEGIRGRVAYVALDAARDREGRKALLTALQPQLRAVSVCFPDPYPPKWRNERGRTLTTSLAHDLYEHLPPGGVVFVASDKEHVAREMCAVLEGLRRVDQPSAPLETNEVAIPTAAPGSHVDAASCARSVVTKEGACFWRVSGDAAAAAALTATLQSSTSDARRVGDCVQHCTHEQIRAQGDAVEASLPSAAPSQRSLGATSLSSQQQQHEEEEKGLQELCASGLGWLGRNVWARPTEREASCERPDGSGSYRHILRALFVRY